MSTVYKKKSKKHLKGSVGSLPFKIITYIPSLINQLFHHLNHKKLL